MLVCSRVICLRAGRRGLVNEHRKVTVAFVGFPDLPADDPEAAASLQAYLAAAVHVVDRFGGRAVRIDELPAQLASADIVFWDGFGSAARASAPWSHRPTRKAR